MLIFLFRLYTTKVKMGTPPREFTVQIDTGSDILWINCNTCSNCPKSSGLGVSIFQLLLWLFCCLGNQGSDLELNFLLFSWYRLSSISLTRLVHPQLRWFLARTPCALLQFKVRQLNAPLRLISAATPFSMKMGVVLQVFMSLMPCILTWFSDNLLLPILLLQLPLFSG